MRRLYPSIVLLVGVVISLLLVQSVTAAPVASLLVAAGDSSPGAKAQANYTCDGLDDHVELQAALAALPEGGTVVLSNGTFNCSGSVAPAAGTTLLGQGPEATFLDSVRTGSSTSRRSMLPWMGFTSWGPAT